MRFTGYAGDCVIEAVIDLPQGTRLTDRLNESSTVALRDVRLHALEDGHFVEVGDLELDIHDLCAVDATTQGGPGEQHIATRSAPVEVEAGPYSIAGQLHGPASSDPVLSIGRRSRMIPLTDATLSFDFAGQAMKLERSVVIFNRDLAVSVRRVPYKRTKLDEFGFANVDPRATDLTRDLSLGLEDI